MFFSIRMKYKMILVLFSIVHAIPIPALPKIAEVMLTEANPLIPKFTRIVSESDSAIRARFDAKQEIFKSSGLNEFGLKGGTGPEAIMDARAAIRARSKYLTDLDKLKLAKAPEAEQRLFKMRYEHAIEESGEAKKLRLRHGTWSERNDLWDNQMTRKENLKSYITFNSFFNGPLTAAFVVPGAYLWWKYDKEKKAAEEIKRRDEQRLKEIQQMNSNPALMGSNQGQGFNFASIPRM